MKNLLMILILILSFASLASAATFVVNLNGDGVDINVGDGNCDVNSTTAGNQCTLRAAIQEANITTALDNINFTIPQAGLRVIQLSSFLPALPTIVNPVVIDGYTQPGASPNTLAVGNNAVLRVEIRSVGCGSDSVLDITGGNSTIRGLILTGGYPSGQTCPAGSFSDLIVLRINGGNIVEGCWFGVRPDGTSSDFRSRKNIEIFSGDNNLIGGLSPQSRNVITNSVGQNIAGIQISGGTNQTIQNNYIGLDPSGTQARPNGGNGIFSSASNTVIGGTSINARNIILGGIRLNNTGNTIQGNYLGVTADGADSLIGSFDEISLFGDGNTVQANNIGAATNTTTASSVAGIFIQSSNNLIGGTNGLTAGDCTGDCNRIAFKTKGVVLDSGNTGLLLTNNRILGNSIYSNTLLGIDLDNDGVTQNDIGDGDIGANNAQNFPVITSARNGSTRIQGTFNSTANRTFRLEFFNSPTNDSSGFGEGQFFIGSTDVTTNAMGDASYDQTFSYISPTSSYVSATATDLTTGDTSEFAQSAQVQFDPTAASVDIGGRVLNANGRGISKAIVTLTNSNGETRYASTNFFGYYRFENVSAGETYIFNATRKGYTFTPQVYSVNQENLSLNFVANP